MKIVYDDLFARHLRGIPHPESPARVEAIVNALRERGGFDFLAARDATDEEIERVHPHDYIELVRRETAALRGFAGYLSTGDTVIDESSLAAARRAAGAAIVAMETAVRDRCAVFAVVRPPGHHAEPSRGMGFCVFNNVAIAARAARAEHGFQTLVADFDYHHGNGTEVVAGGGLSYVSSHASPAYPGTGSVSATRELEGGDIIIDVALPPRGISTEAFVDLWQRILPEAAERVKPQLLLVSAGFDYVAGDPVGDLGIDVSAAGQIAPIIRSVAEQYCEGRVVYVLEGGYLLDALASSVLQIAGAHD